MIRGGDWVRGWRAFYTYGSTACVLAGLCGVGDFVRANNTLWLQPGSVPAVFVGLQWVRAYSTYRFSRSYAWRHSSRRTLLTNDI